MKMFTGKQSIYLAVVLSAAMLLYCNANPKPATQPTIKITDFRNKTIHVPSPSKRIICLIESALTGFYMLHAQESIIAVPASVYGETVFHYYAQLDERIKNKKLPAPGNWDFISIENIVALKPDLVILWAQQTEAIESLESKNIPVYAVFIDTFEDVYKEIIDIGKITGTQGRAHALITYSKEKLNSFKNISGTGNAPRVYFMWAQSLGETSGKTSTVNELIEYAGGINVANKYEYEHLTVNIETLIRFNPEYIIMWHNTRLNPVDIIKDTRLSSLEAVKKKNVFEFPSAFDCDLWTLKFIYAVSLISAWIHEGSMHDGALAQEKNEIFRFLYGKPLQ